MMTTINMVTLILAIMISIAFFTLMERKMISYTQMRKGPNKVSMVGILQPMADAIKLMSKEMNLNKKSNFTIYMMSPSMNLTFSMVMWTTMPFLFNFNFMKMSMMFIMICTAMNTVSIMLMSWSSNSNYAFLGMIRTIAQMISYEINFMMIIITTMNMTEQMNMNLMEKLQKYMPLMAIVPNLMMMWMMSVLAETNRTPFDFSEGESELVSGFNVEFSSKTFMFLFLAEYASILMMSMMTAILFVTKISNTKLFMMTYTSICLFFIWTRTTFPRFRYDKLMKMNWTQLLPLTTTMLMTSFTMKMYSTKKVNKINEQ